MPRVDSSHAIPIPLTPDALSFAVEWWQRQLRLQDWDIRASVVRYYLDPDGALGRTKVHASTREAIVTLTDPADHHPDSSDVDRDLEVTLVHELLHVAFPHDSPDGSCSQDMERAIDSTARALVNLRRGAPR